MGKRITQEDVRRARAAAASAATWEELKRTSPIKSEKALRDRGIVPLKGRERRTASLDGDVNMAGGRQAPSSAPGTYKEMWPSDLKQREAADVVGAALDWNTPTSRDDLEAKIREDQGWSRIGKRAKKRLTRALSDGVRAGEIVAEGSGKDRTYKLSSPPVPENITEPVE